MTVENSHSCLSDTIDVCMPCGGTDKRFANQLNDHLNTHMKQPGVTIQQSYIFQPHEDGSDNLNELIAEPPNPTPSNICHPLHNQLFLIISY